MPSIEEVPVPGVGRTRREIGHAGGHTPGPTFICLAALHGNEPSGVRALRRVFRKIEQQMISLRGEFVGIAGNLAGLAAGRRYLARDLNRCWTLDTIDRLDRGVPDEVPEDAEQRELLEVLRRFVARRRGEVVLLDLHTASAPTTPFVILGDTLRNREFARSIPTPMVLGFEEQLVGTLMEYVTGLGHVALAFEAGQHEEPAAVNHHEAVIWIALVRAGALPPEAVPEFERFHRLLGQWRHGLPGILEIFHRHAVRPDDGFVMQPGFRNFQRVKRGQLLATNRHGEIRAPRGERVFLPLYQGLGEDGFFLARPINPFWLALSSWVRRLGLPALAPRLPGVRRHPVLRDRLCVDPRVARIFTRQVFHLLGYRVHSPEDGRLVVSRRREEGPDD